MLKAIKNVEDSECWSRTIRQIRTVCAHGNSSIIWDTGLKSPKMFLFSLTSVVSHCWKQSVCRHLWTSFSLNRWLSVLTLPFPQRDKYSPKVAVCSCLFNAGWLHQNEWKRSLGLLRLVSSKYEFHCYPRMVLDYTTPVFIFTIF